MPFQAEMSTLLCQPLQDDFAPYLDILTDELQDLYWGGISALRDGELEVGLVKAMLLSVISDYRGYPELFRITQSPALVGACYKCNQPGTRTSFGRKTIYAGETIASAVPPKPAIQSAFMQYSFCRLLLYHSLPCLRRLLEVAEPHY